MFSYLQAGTSQGHFTTVKSTPSQQEGDIAQDPLQVVQGAARQKTVQFKKKKKNQEENLENSFAFIDSNENILPIGGL